MCVYMNAWIVCYVCVYECLGCVLCVCIWMLGLCVMCVYMNAWGRCVVCNVCKCARVGLHEGVERVCANFCICAHVCLVLFWKCKQPAPESSVVMMKPVGWWDRNTLSDNLFWVKDRSENPLDLFCLTQHRNHFFHWKLHPLSPAEITQNKPIWTHLQTWIIRLT
jgi:hypothetical protein